MSFLPRVSVVIVNFDRADCLARAVKAMEFQRYLNFELIIVSNQPVESRPASPLLINWIAFSEANISAARNRGLAAAQGEFVAFCDDDAVPEFGWLTALVAPFEQENIGSAGGWVRGRNGVSYQWKTVFINQQADDFSADLPDMVTKTYAPDPDKVLKTVGTNCAFRRQALVDIGGFDEAYHFFLDEADVNMRLAKAGWFSAIVPLAEVHHGFAAGPYRTEFRVPKSLLEIGASHAHFLKNHAPGAVETALKKFDDAQTKRLSGLFFHGQIDGEECERLLASLREGFEQGCLRDSKFGQFETANSDFQPAITKATPARRRLFVSQPMNKNSMREAARNAADAGAEVTLIEPIYTHHNLTVCFSPEGYWRHRFGLLGRSERSTKRPLTSRKCRLEQELIRIHLQRGELTREL